MRFRSRRSPRVAVFLICVCTLTALCLFQYQRWRRVAACGQTVPEQFAARYAPLGPLLPAAEITRFVVDEPHADLDLLHRDARLFLAQYAVSPKRLTVSGDKPSRWIVVDSDRPDVMPEMAAAGSWTLIADLHNGVRLYCTEPGE